MRVPLPGTEGDVIEFIEYLSMEERVSGEYFRKYLYEVSRY